MNTYTIFEGDTIHPYCAEQYNRNNVHLSLGINLYKQMVVGIDTNLTDVLNPDYDYSDYLIRRRIDRGGVLIGSSGAFFFAIHTPYKFDIHRFMKDVFADLSIEVNHKRNDFLCNGKKICGTATLYDPCSMRYTSTVIIIVSEDMTAYDNAFVIPSDKAERHNAFKVSERTCAITDYYPDITIDVMIEAILNEYNNYFGDIEHVDPDTIKATAEYQKLKTKYLSSAWIEKPQRRPDLIMKKIAFSDGYEVEVSNFYMNTVGGKERITVMIPIDKIGDVTAVSSRYGDATKTNTITAFYCDDASPDWIRDKAFTGFTKPVYFAGDSVRYQMVLEKKTAEDVRMEDLLRRIEALEKAQ